MEVKVSRLEEILKSGPYSLMGGFFSSFLDQKFLWSDPKQFDPAFT